MPPSRNIPTALDRHPDGIYHTTGLHTGHTGQHASSVTFVIIPRAPGPVCIELQLPRESALRATQARSSTISAETSPPKRRHDDSTSDASSRKKLRNVHEMEHIAPAAAPVNSTHAPSNGTLSRRVFLKPAEPGEESVTEPETEPDSTPAQPRPSLEDFSVTEPETEREAAAGSTAPRASAQPAVNSPEDSVTEPETDPEPTTAESKQEVEYPDWLVEAVLKSVMQKVLGGRAERSL